jgi:hypothetical protein
MSTTFSISATSGEQRRLYDRRKADILPQQGIRLVVIHKSEFTTKADKVVRDHALRWASAWAFTRFLNPGTGPKCPEASPD